MDGGSCVEVVKEGAVCVERVLTNWKGTLINGMLDHRRASRIGGRRCWSRPQLPCLIHGWRPSLEVFRSEKSLGAGNKPTKLLL